MQYTAYARPDAHKYSHVHMYIIYTYICVRHAVCKYLILYIRMSLYTQDVHNKHRVFAHGSERNVHREGYVYVAIV